MSKHRNADKTTKRVDGEDLEKSAFAYRPTDKTEDWKLPIEFSTEEKTKSHIRNAIARWSSTDMPDADEKSKARDRIKAAAKEHDIDVEEGSLAKAKPGFHASMKSDTLELQIYEDIGPDWFGEGLTAKTVKQQIDAAGNFNRISVRINSPGGDAFEGVAIYNLLRAQKKPVDVFVDGIAASAASVIAMAGDTINMGTGAMIMIHNAMWFCFGDAQALRAAADVIENVSVTIGTIFVQRTGVDAAKLKEMMDAETWMNGEQALELGFATALIDNSDREALALARTFKSLAKLKHVPDALKNANDDDIEPEIGCGCACDECMSGNCDACDCNGCPVCDASDCAGCADDMANNNLSQYEARLRLLHAA